MNTSVKINIFPSPIRLRHSVYTTHAHKRIYTHTTRLNVNLSTYDGTGRGGRRRDGEKLCRVWKFDIGGRAEIRLLGARADRRRRPERKRRNERMRFFINFLVPSYTSFAYKRFRPKEYPTNSQRRTVSRLYSKSTRAKRCFLLTAFVTTIVLSHTFC